MHRHERADLDASLAHALEETVMHIPTAHVIVDETDLDTLTGLVDKRIGHHSAQ